MRKHMKLCYIIKINPDRDLDPVCFTNCPVFNMTNANRIFCLVHLYAYVASVCITSSKQHSDISNYLCIVPDRTNDYKFI